MQFKYSLFAFWVAAFSVVIGFMSCKKEKITGPSTFTFNGITYAAGNTSCNSQSGNNNAVVTSVSSGETVLNIVNQVPTGTMILQPIYLCPDCPYVTVTSGDDYFQAISGKLNFDGSVMSINATMQMVQSTTTPTYTLIASVGCQ